MDLYQAIFERRSVRRYAPQPLDEQTLGQVRGIISLVQPLVPGNQFAAPLHHVAPGQDLVAALGGYGRIVSPTHYLVPYLVGQEHPLTGLGYRVEQIAVRLVRLGLGSCYIGALGREQDVRARFGLPAGARVGALLVFGYPTMALGGRVVNDLMRRASGATNKLPADRIFYRDHFKNPVPPRGDLGQLIEAARNAPSAVNAQPWRFLWRDHVLHLFVRRRGTKYGSGEMNDYRLYDGGICMANVTLAMDVLHIGGQWQLLEPGDPDVPDHPDDLEPLARLALERVE